MSENSQFICNECKWNYPDHLLSPLVTNKGNTELVCGICALELMNESTGIKRTRFTGQVAEQMRLAAVQWRKDNPKP